MITKEKRDELLLSASRAERLIDVGSVELRAGETGDAITAEQRDEMLARCAAGAYVELYLTILAYEQRDGDPNRAFVKLRPSAMAGAAKSAIGRPFLRDHLQENTLATGGKIVASKSEKRGDGDYAIRMTIKLTALWAVEMALRDLLSFVSIGLRPNGPVLCSICGTEVFTQCAHYRGDEVVAKAGAAPQICEWIYTSTEIVELSCVPVPAVVGAQIEGIRAALSALYLSPKDRNTMRLSPALLAALNLAATAGDDEILPAVEVYLKSQEANKLAAGIAEADLAAITAERDVLLAAKTESESKAFVDEAIGLGKIAATDGDRETWSTLYALDKDKAVKLMAARKQGQATPIGTPRQTAPVVVTDPVLASPSITGGERVGGRTFQGRVAVQLAAAKVALAGNEQAQAYAADLFGYRGAINTNLSATSIGNNAAMDAARVGFNVAMLESVVGDPDPIFALATEVTSNKAMENYNWLGDLPSMEEWKNDRVMSQLEAYGFSIKNKKWQATLRVKNDDFKDDALGMLPAHVSEMGAQARLQPSELIAALLLNGFDGSNSAVGDGLAFDGAFFFSTSHATGSNKLALAFSSANLLTAGTMLRSMKRFDGRKNLRAKGTHLYVGVGDEELANKIMTQEQLTGGESNTLKGRYTVVVCPEFDAGEWFLADQGGAIRPMIFQNREGIITSTVGGQSVGGQSDTVGFMYDETWFGATSRNNAGYLDFRKIIGCKP